jgi:serine phosphatase RsbU (regulator of sigma subunit)
MNFDDQTFGKARLKEALVRVSIGVDSAETVAQALLWEVRKFAGIAKRTDDITMIVVKVNGPAQSPPRPITVPRSRTTPAPAAG